MESIRLSPRMEAIAAFIPEGSRVADVGTDHGYIPVWLAQTGRAAAIAATDINAGPLARARQSARESGVEAQIRFAQCSGLDFPGSSDYDTVVIAGMGGELIASILEAAPWTRQGTLLILQPNSKIDVLSRWLDAHGYRIENVRLVKDSGKLYQVLTAAGGAASGPVTAGEALVNRLYLERQDPLLPEYLDGLIARQRHALDGLLKGQNETERIRETEQILSELLEMRKETETWQQ